MKQGLKPSLEEIAEEALVSRATAYRYFAGAEPLLAEASVDIAIPSEDDVFRGTSATDPVLRVQRVDSTLHDVMLANEAQLRMMLVHSLQRSPPTGEDGGLPLRQNRRTPLIEAALAPARQRLKPADLTTLCRALALIIGTEGMIVFKDVLQLDDGDARKVKRWAIRALVQAAIRPDAPA
jgi:AcrR family transcriptional regulator